MASRDQAASSDDPGATAGELTGPTITKAGSSSATVLSTAQGGPGVAIAGGSDEGSYLLAMYGAPGAPPDAVAEATVAPAAGAAFVFMMIGTGSSYSKRQLRLERLPGSNELEAESASGTVACGVLDDRPTALTLQFHAAAQTFDVLLDGANTQCTNLPTLMQAPVAELELMDASNAGYGGRVEFSDLAVH
jgi:hypothetical protein